MYIDIQSRIKYTKKHINQKITIKYEDNNHHLVEKIPI